MSAKRAATVEADTAEDENEAAAEAAAQTQGMSRPPLTGTCGTYGCAAIIERPHQYCTAQHRKWDENRLEDLRREQHRLGTSLGRVQSDISVIVARLGALPADVDEQERF